MDTNVITPARLASSVIAVPPLARDKNYNICPIQNAKIIKHIEGGGVSSLLYGGNAMFYHLRPSEYASTLTMLADTVADQTLVVPSVGPAYGLMMDQADVLKDFDFPTVMVLPSREIANEDGLAIGIRKFAESYGKPIVLYLKHDRWLSPSIVESLHRDGLISWIKYAVVLEDTTRDPYLREVLQKVPSEIVVSGIGEQPAIIHLRDFGINGYTSGCVCVAPKMTTKMLKLIKAKDYAAAEKIRVVYEPLEDLRNEINPIRVLHFAVEMAGIADTGPIQPMLSEIGGLDAGEIALTATELLHNDREFVA